MRALAVLLLLILLIAGGTLAAVKHTYGGGDEFPDRHPAAARLPESALEVVADLPTPPGNIAVSADGRVFVSLHPEAHPDLKVVELVKGRMVPFPAPSYQDPKDPWGFDNVLGIRIDAQHRLWTLDNGTHGTHPVRLLAFDLTSNLRVHDVTFPRDIAPRGSHLNDFQVSPDGRFVYIADASFFGKTPAIVVYDVEHKSARRVLQNHPSVLAERYLPVVQGRRMEAYGLVAIRPGVNGIALDAAGEWLYFAPITNLNLSRIRTADLLNTSLSAAELAGRVEVYAPKTMSDGIAMDAAGNVYLTDLEHSAIVVLRADKTLETLIQSDRLRWPDGATLGPDGALYVTCSSLHQVIGLPRDSVAQHAPYQVFRIALAPPPAAAAASEAPAEVSTP